MDDKLEVHTERSQIRARQLQNQVVALNEQIRALKEQNLKHREAEFERAKEVNGLQEQLIKERERIQRLAVNLASYRRKEQISKSCDQIEVNCCHICNEGLEGYSKITPAQINLVKQSPTPLKTIPRGAQQKFNLESSQQAANIHVLKLTGTRPRTCHGTGQLELHVQGKTCHSMVESCLSHPGIAFSSEWNNHMNVPDLSEKVQTEFFKILQEVGLGKKSDITSKNSASELEDGTRNNENTVTLGSRGFYVTVARGESTNVCENEKTPSATDMPTIRKLFKAINLLEIDNARLRKALVGEKEKEVSELEKQLKDIKDAASFTISSNTLQETAVQTDCNNLDSSQINMNPITFLDRVRELESLISEKNRAIFKLTLEPSQVEMDEKSLVDQRVVPELGMILDAPASSDTVYCSHNEPCSPIIETSLSDSSKSMKQMEESLDKILKGENAYLQDNYDRLKQEGQGTFKETTMLQNRKQRRKSRAGHSSSQIKDLEVTIAGLKTELEQSRRSNSELMLALRESKTGISRKKK